MVLYEKMFNRRMHFKKQKKEEQYQVLRPDELPSSADKHGSVGSSSVCIAYTFVPQSTTNEHRRYTRNKNCCRKHRSKNKNQCLKQESLHIIGSIDKLYYSTYLFTDDAMQFDIGQKKIDT